MVFLNFYIFTPMHETDIVRKLENWLETVGSPVLRDEAACQLLAALVHGYFDDAALNGLYVLVADLNLAAQKLNLRGDCFFNNKILTGYKRCYTELEYTKKDTPWLQELFQRYGIPWIPKTV